MKSRTKDVGVYRPPTAGVLGGLTLDTPRPRPELDLHEEPPDEGR
jgi:hypothetical protein